RSPRRLRLLEQAGDDRGDQAAGDGRQHHVVAAAHIVVPVRRGPQAVPVVVVHHIGVGPVVGRHALAIGPGADRITARRHIARGGVAPLGPLPARIGLLLFAVLAPVLAIFAAIVAAVAAILAPVVAPVLPVIPVVLTVLAPVVARLGVGGRGDAERGGRDEGCERDGEGLFHDGVSCRSE